MEELAGEQRVCEQHAESSNLMRAVLPLLLTLIGCLTMIEASLMKNPPQIEESYIFKCFTDLREGSGCKHGPHGSQR